MTTATSWAVVPCGTLATHVRSPWDVAQVSHWSECRLPAAGTSSGTPVSPTWLPRGMPLITESGTELVW